ncbi:uncharacterized protein A1O9_02434 [Exophiala aquamarina CBS 119918]|uniref:Fructose-bisphosphate aldolase n=1 Tax=Exophiala aquamarina CBS 119918 TaxID=1182545 RepID=A0A072PMB1_9EURO|nr:uncharacterized protein A1O9_02434 [Exophiala aquamarina CBS 119918]KEF60872.1 hypothetical protein A1O9_02434 [Exophiala aquamarina CBS 119918]
MISSTKGNKTLNILKAAAAGSYGVLAAIAYNVEHITALVQAAEAKHSPLILLLFPSTLTQLPSLVWAASAAANSATVPISVHIDHAQDKKQIRHVIDSLPVDSIMVDMSHHNIFENLSETRKLAALCHAKGIAVEAESGRINGSEDGIADTGDLEALLTSATDVEDFLDTEIDMLAPSVGNIHGDYGPDGPQLDFPRLHSIATQLNGQASLVLHGTNDFSPELMRDCVRAGVTKINVNKLLLEPWNEYLRENSKHRSLTQLIDEGIQILRAEAERWIDIVGSSNQAWVTQAGVHT